jgi:hypothetical protein
MILITSLNSCYFAVKDELESDTNMATMSMGPFSSSMTSFLTDYGFTSMITGSSTLFSGTVYCDYAMIYIHYVLEMISNIKYTV